MKSGIKVRAGARDVDAAEEGTREDVEEGRLKPEEARRIQV